MSDRLILPMRAAVGAACRELDAAIGLFLDASRTLPCLGTYESEVEALNLFYLAIRDTEGVIALVRADLVLLPAAIAASRAAFEVAVKAAWMIDADDPYNREVRWLTHLRSEERYYDRVAQRLESLGNDAKSLRARTETFRSFRQAVVQILPAGYHELPGLPSFEDMLKSVGGSALYAL